jgi:hypothetical protein
MPNNTVNLGKKIGKLWGHGILAKWYNGEYYTRDLDQEPSKKDEKQLTQWQTNIFWVLPRPSQRRRSKGKKGREGVEEVGREKENIFSLSSLTKSVCIRPRVAGLGYQEHDFLDVIFLTLLWLGCKEPTWKGETK